MLSTLSLRARLTAPLAALLLAGAAQAGPLPSPLSFVEFGGPAFGADAGPGLIFDAGTGLGGWLGVLQPTPAGDVAFDTLATFGATPEPAGGERVRVSGAFRFVLRDFAGATPALDLLAGTLDGTLAADPSAPSQFLLDLAYTIDTGLGRFAGFVGSGHSRLRYDSALADPDTGAFSYSGSGRLDLGDPRALPEPGTLALAAAALLAAGWSRRRLADGTDRRGGLDLTAPRNDGPVEPGAVAPRLRSS